MHMTQIGPCPAGSGLRAIQDESLMTRIDAAKGGERLGELPASRALKKVIKVTRW
jgi:hypothetical protein